MGLQIIIRNKTKYKGRNITEFQNNLESEGWPRELDELTRDKVKFIEKKEGRPLRKSDLRKLR